ncbi:MAG TPA: hypothetical protein VFA33_04880 [Bryobacteraceae bacterium]|nr:hypothetical protein [Bryobacteraceae bacterium]
MEFLAAHIESMKSSFADDLAEAAKRKALALLGTDIDILVFVVAAGLMYSQMGRDLLTIACRTDDGTEEGYAGAVAEVLVQVVEKAIATDKEYRRALPGRPE